LEILLFAWRNKSEDDMVSQWTQTASRPSSPSLPQSWRPGSYPRFHRTVRLTWPQSLTPSLMQRGSLNG
jgi:hypothetical protein